MAMIISSKEKLIYKFGNNGFSKVNNKLKEYASAVGGVLYYIEDYGILNDPISIGNFINSRDQNGENSVLIVGGDNIIPFHKVNNPASDDGDEIIYTDNIYASIDDEILIPERSVGRIPDGDNLNFLISVLDNLLEYRGIHTEKAKGIIGLLLEIINMILGKKKENVDYSISGSLGDTAKVWVEASKNIYCVLSENFKNFYSCPPTKFDNLNEEQKDKKEYYYFNLHGSEIGSNWYGQENATDEILPIAIKPSDLNNLHIKGCIVCSEACYGAKLSQGSIALKFLEKGCIGFCGSTKIAYGNDGLPLCDADIIAKKFLSYVMNGETFGNALMKAKQDFVIESSRKGYLDATEKKTLLEFVLYGDPDLKLKI
ncbi:MAG: C25 family cysteine peptidase [Candidatus Altarchaeaceae archaeon]